MYNEMSFHDLTTVVEAMLKKGSIEVLGIRMNIESSYYFRDEDFDIFDDEKFKENNPDIDPMSVYSFEQTKFVDLIFSRRSNYTLVMARVHKLYEDDPCSNEHTFEIQSYHDSCWRSDGLRILNDTMRDAEKYVIEMCKKYLSVEPPRDEMYIRGKLDSIKIFTLKEEEIIINREKSYKVIGDMKLSDELSISPI